jgi:hypothetical protein
MEKYYGISLDAFYEDWEWVENVPNEGPAAHYVTAKSKKALAEAMAQGIKKWVMENAYPSDDYGYATKEE